MINDILTAIMARLADKEPAIKYIDEDWGQLDYYQENPPVKFPAVLLEMQQASWQNQSRNVQDAVVTVCVRVADIKTSNTGLRAPALQKEKAAAIWQVIENVHKALHGWRPADYPAFGALTRLRTTRTRRDDGIREFQIEYSCLYTDASANITASHVATPEVEITNG